MRKILNKIRTFLIFRLRYPWVIHGKNVHCQFSTTFWSPHNHIILGDNVGIGYDCLFQCDTEIRNNVLIASNVAS